MDSEALNFGRRSAARPHHRVLRVGAIEISTGGGCFAICKLWSLAWLVGLGLASCAVIPAEPDGGRLLLDPPDPRPVLAIEVADDIEVDLLRQQLKLEPVRQQGTLLYFHEGGDVAERLRTHGYLPIRANAYDVFRRVVRVQRNGEEDALAKFGVNLVNREKTYWVVEGSLGSLRALQQAGFRLSELGANEPSPREVSVRLRSRGDAQRIAEMHVDIFSVVDTKSGAVLTGAAFDHQIDRMRAAGFEVERVSTPPPGEQP